MVSPPRKPTPAAQDLLDRANRALDGVPDPEIPVVSIRELGILRGVALQERDDGPHVEVIITPIYSGCPAMTQIADDIHAALRAADLPSHSVHTVLAPAWTTDWITPAARDKLRAYGIAPPHAATGLHACAGETAAGAAPPARPIRWTLRADIEQDPACPRCGSPATERIAQSGSTACKALYRCRSCREPFDYFKPY
ncbi:MAG: phenylacetate-CoA oxygenase subunit PaaJ [Candidatus Protistobacter heckmanni]|nr:phenylacetate-CoA oxygenase subunit PaaJ [Candidatus Protistobacter heckmanni]